MLKRILIEHIFPAEKETIDDYGRQLKGGETCLRATFLEKETK